MVLAKGSGVSYSDGALLDDGFSDSMALSGSDAMDMRIRSFGWIAVFLTAAALATTGGCTNKTKALFTKPELITRGRLAVLGLTPEQEQIFMASYVKAFPGQIITFVERNRLQEILSEQDLLEGRLNEKTRARIKQLFGVEALIMCTYYDADSGVAKKKLRVRIVDSETGAILGSVITEGRDYFEYHSQRAVNEIKADVLNGSR
jgi:hypothetical protein